jgi:hypothetical protein
VIYNKIVKKSFKIVKTYYINEAPDYNFEVICYKIEAKSFKIEAQNYNLEVIYFKLVAKSFKNEAQSYNFEVIYYKIEAQSFKIVQIYCENEVRNFKHVSFCFIFVAF